MVERSHHFPPKAAPDCGICRDSGFYKWDGTWRVCLNPEHKTHVGYHAEKQKDCDEMNNALRSLEKRTGAK